MSNPVSALGHASFDGFAKISEIGPLGMITLRAKPDVKGLAKAVKAVMALEVLLEFILTTTVQMETFGIVLFRRVQQEQVVLVAMAVLEATEERAEVFKLRVLQKLVTVVPEALVVLEEPEEREAMEPTE